MPVGEHKPEAISGPLIANQGCCDCQCEIFIEVIMLNTQSLIAAAILSGVTVVSFAQAPAAADSKEAKVAPAVVSASAAPAAHAKASKAVKAAEVKDAAAAPHADAASATKHKAKPAAAKPAAEAPAK